MEDNDPFYLVPEEFYYSMSRDVSRKELNRKSITWWEILIYLTMLALAFSVSGTMIK